MSIEPGKGKYIYIYSFVFCFLFFFISISRFFLSNLQVRDSKFFVLTSFFNEEGEQCFRSAKKYYSHRCPDHSRKLEKRESEGGTGRVYNFRSWVVAGYLGCWPGCWLHGRRQGRAAGPSFAFRVPPFFPRLLRHIPPPRPSTRPGAGRRLAHARPRQRRTHRAPTR